MASVVSVWSTKGGVGVTTTATLLALGQVAKGRDTVLIDLVGDVPAVLGIAEPDGPGLVDWCAMSQPTADSLSRITVEVAPGLMVVPRGDGEFVGRAETLIQAAATTTRQVIVDCGQMSTSGFHADVAAAASFRLLVVRSCFLTLRSASRFDAVIPTGVILLREASRVLGLADVEALIDAPVLAQITLDVSVARAVDAGLLTSRVPGGLRRVMGRVVLDAA